jgi:hypothetical protein
MAEFILCAAVHYEDKIIYRDQPQGIHTGFVVAGYRHHNCMETVRALLERFYNKRNILQGFLTSRNRFINRKEAFEIHIGQHPDLKPMSDERELFSEDLY